MCIGLIDAVRAAVLTGHCPEHPRTEHPLVQFLPALAERIFKTCSGPAPKPSSEIEKPATRTFVITKPFHLFRNRGLKQYESLPGSRRRAGGYSGMFTHTDRFPEKHVFGPEIGQWPQRPNYRRCQVRSNATEPRTAPPPELAAMLCKSGLTRPDSTCLSGGATIVMSCSKAT